MQSFVAPAGLGLIEVLGSDRASFLNAVLSQEVEALPPGRVAGALFLDAHGAPQAMVDVAVLEDRILLVPAADLAEELASTLQRRTFLADARLTSREVASWALREGVEPDVAAAGLSDVASPIGPSVPEGRVELREDGVLVIGRGSGLDLVGPPDAVEGLVERAVEAGARRADAGTLEAWRVAAGVPGWGREVRAPHLPEEMGLLPTHVHLRKGCYPGQEAVARMWMLGRPRRRLARVRLGGAAEAGWSTGTGKQRAEVTSAAILDSERVGLAYVPADARPGDRFGDEAAQVEVLGLVGEGRPIPGHDPAVVRRRDRPR